MACRDAVAYAHVRLIVKHGLIGSLPGVGKLALDPRVEFGYGCKTALTRSLLSITSLKMEGKKCSTALSVTSPQRARCQRNWKR